MSIISLWYYLTGYLVISIHGRGKEKLINLASRRGIGLWNIYWRGETVEAKIRDRDLALLIDLAERTRTRIEVMQRLGLPFLGKRLSHRKGLLIGIILFFIILYFCSSFIWIVEVDGAEKVKDDEILYFLEENGLRQGAFIRNVDIKTLERDLLINFKNLCWVTVEIQGTRAVVYVEETLGSLTDEVHPAENLVASRDGLIERILVLIGQPAVKTGDTVSKGELLVKGSNPEVSQGLPEKTDAENKITDVLPQIKAKGEVWARTWYTEQVKVPLVVEAYVKTGENCTRYSLKINERMIKISGDPHFNLYRVRTTKWHLDWRNTRLPVELIQEQMQELELFSYTRTIEQAYEIAKFIAEDRLAYRVPNDAKVLNKIEKQIPHQGAVVLKVTWELVENIAVPAVKED